MIHGSFKNCYRQIIRLQIMSLIYMDKQDLTLNNQLGLICRKAQPTQPSQQGL